MELITFSNIERFKNTLEHYLKNNEALNCMLISALLKANDATITSLGAYYQESKIDLAWMLTHEKLLMLTESTKTSLQLLTDHFLKQHPDIYKIRGPTYSVDLFLRLTDLNAYKSMMLNVYQIDKVLLHHQSPGQFRKAEFSDILYLKSCVEEFVAETKLDPVDSNALLRKLIKERRLYLWEIDNTIVSIAAYSGPTFTGIRLNLVFTPKKHRGKGYASSCVGELGNHLLKHGYKKCFIFADQKNHTANSIYKKLGFDLMGSYKECTLSKDIAKFLQNEA